MGNETFNKALSNMTNEIAYKAAVRHLVDIGYSVKEIEKQLTYPVSFDKIQKCVYEYTVESGLILLEEPSESKSVKKVDYVLEEGKYGQKTYRRVVLDEKETLAEEYFSCDFGLMKETEMDNLLTGLPNKDREYITGIPWPKRRVYIRKTPRTEEIFERIENGRNS